MTDDAKALVARDDIDLVVEVIGGIDFPRELVLAALNSGKSVVTANKAPWPRTQTSWRRPPTAPAWTSTLRLPWPPRSRW